VKYEVVGFDTMIPLVTHQDQKYKTSIVSCSLNKGCSVEVSVEGDCRACNFGFSLADQGIRNHLIVYEVKENVIAAKVDFEEELFFRREMEPNRHCKVVVNTPNVMLYVNFQNYTRCKRPTAFCHQFVANQQNPIILTNTHEQPQALIIGVVGLEQTDFKVTFVEKAGGLTVQLG
jgi:hypothetical protein